jgi:hypothetical protein
MFTEVSRPKSATVTAANTSGSERARCHSCTDYNDGEQDPFIGCHRLLLDILTGLHFCSPNLRDFSTAPYHLNLKWSRHMFVPVKID